MKNYSVHIICEVSQRLGMGHLIRSCLLARELERHHRNVRLSVISLMAISLPVELACQKLNIIPHDRINDIILNDNISDLYILDLIELNHATQSLLIDLELPVIGLSYVNNYRSVLDIYIGRKKLNVVEDDELIQDVDLRNCIYYRCNHRIEEKMYSISRNQEMVEVGIFMGGGCGLNVYNAMLTAISKTSHKVYLKVIVGQASLFPVHEIENLLITSGFSNYSIKKFDGIESIWDYLSHCGFVICSGGLTAFESVHKGLPFICLAHKDHQLAGVSDLVDMGCGFSMRIDEYDSVPALIRVIKFMLNKDGTLEWMNKICLYSFQYEGAARVVRVMDQHMKSIQVRSVIYSQDKIALHA